MSVSSYRSEGACSSSRSHSEGFLYLYLSIMLVIFTVVFVVDVYCNSAVKNLKEAQIVSDDISSDPNSTNDSTVLVERTIDLFLDEQSAFHVGGVDALRFLLHSHDVHARVLITGSLNSPELAYARALLLQSELENSALYHNDVSIELDFSSDKGGEVFVTLYEGMSTGEELS